jgi:hypothetical protein
LLCTPENRNALFGISRIYNKANFAVFLQRKALAPQRNSFAGLVPGIVAAGIALLYSKLKVLKAHIGH